MCLPFKDLEERRLSKGEHKGFEWETIHTGSGYRCGYVKVLPGHPWFGKGYKEIKADVHGTVTFAEHGKACPTHGPEAEWWVGFDCGHQYMDLPDPELPVQEGAFRPMEALATLFNLSDWMFTSEGHEQEIAAGKVVRDQAYVEAQCRHLAEQAAAA